MKSKKYLVSLVALLVLAVLSIANVSAFGSITSVEVNGIEGTMPNNVATFSGETLPVRVVFKATADATDVRVKVWIAGDKEYSVSSERFDVIAGKIYSKLVSVTVPFNIEPQEDLKLEVSVESRKEGSADKKTIALSGQRESYVVEVLDVNFKEEVLAGENLALDIVLKNRGRKLSEDTFVRVSIPALHISQKVYFGDLSSKDQSHPDKEDAVEGKLSLKIPSNAKAGTYVLEIEAYNSESVTTLSKKVAIVGSGEESAVVSSAKSKTFAVGETEDYSMTLVNSGNRVQIYELVVGDIPRTINVELEESVFAIPAGSSETVKLKATATKAGKYDFSVNVHSNKNLVTKQNFTAEVEEKTTKKITEKNTTVLLTVVLAIIFVVLLVVLIVLLTRKPEKSQELGESYY
ncbi:MAG: hypothetical protein AABW65_02870 [Nanoarchaeota archaeon]